ncbi:MAG: SRPBCC family protein [Sphingopyxis sp.]|uniref:SRPBCC family protein n=1 Tax=Sphingopyxis sp. TaxID=1908224 RepID=UPI002AB80560|nr:SRPBCC family protein [Sphingopyxis sp.]MDZ3831965.1 SRPBCC family protein [Sphingopyxis sp.]
MVDFERERILPYSPAQVWAVLADFENHKIWNPYTRIQALQEDPVLLRYELRMDPHKPKFVEVPAILLAAYPERLLTIDVRPNFLLKFEESYALTPTEGGTKLHHSYSVRGFLVGLRLPGVRTSFERMLESIDGILLSWLDRKYKGSAPKAVPPSKPIPRPKPKYRGGRR